MRAHTLCAHCVTARSEVVLLIHLNVCTHWYTAAMCAHTSTDHLGVVIGVIAGCSALMLLIVGLVARRYIKQRRAAAAAAFARQEARLEKKRAARQLQSVEHQQQDGQPSDEQESDEVQALEQGDTPSVSPHGGASLAAVALEESAT
jgi:hypothetical protein